mmetsp:Transcript_27418/g.60721  ORF Transcript_27418/g.60721 Transcript_27418/m.60721 type:complete len:233 (-) Transcript_27418:156-854(-)
MSYVCYVHKDVPNSLSLSVHQPIGQSLPLLGASVLSPPPLVHQITKVLLIPRALHRAPLPLLVLPLHLACIAHAHPHLPLLGLHLCLCHHLTQLVDAVLAVAGLGSELLRGHDQLPILADLVALVIRQPPTHVRLQPVRRLHVESRLRLGVQLVNILPTGAGGSCVSEADSVQREHNCLDQLLHLLRIQRHLQLRTQLQPTQLGSHSAIPTDHFELTRSYSRMKTIDILTRQ